MRGAERRSGLVCTALVERVLANGVHRLEIHTDAQVPRTSKALTESEVESGGVRS